MTRRYLPGMTLLALVGAMIALDGCSSTTSTGSSSQGGVGNLGVQSLLFIKRQTKVTTTNPDGTVSVTYDVDNGNGQVLDYQRYVPGGSLNLLSTANGTVTSLTPSFAAADFNGADVSF